MARAEDVELANMCMLCDGKGNVLVQDKIGNAAWHGWNFPGGHVEKGEYVTPSVIREMKEETGLTIENPKLCGIKEFHKTAEGNPLYCLSICYRSFLGRAEVVRRRRGFLVSTF